MNVLKLSVDAQNMFKLEEFFEVLQALKVAKDNDKLTQGVIKAVAAKWMLICDVEDTLAGMEASPTKARIEVLVDGCKELLTEIVTSDVSGKMVMDKVRENMNDIRGMLVIVEVLPKEMLKLDADSREMLGAMRETLQRSAMMAIQFGPDMRLVKEIGGLLARIEKLTSGNV